MRIAQIAPLAEAVPPKLYGGTERVAFWLTEELVEMGHEVTLFASGDSITSAKLVPCSAKALRLDRNSPDPLLVYAAMLTRVAEKADQFDLVHAHTDWLHIPLLRALQVPFLTTLHGRLDHPALATLSRDCFADAHFVWISDAQRLPLAHALWAGTVYHGLPEHLLTPNFDPEGYLAYLGRITPGKGPETAIQLARAAGMPQNRREDRAGRALLLQSTNKAAHRRQRGGVRRRNRRGAQGRVPGNEEKLAVDSIIRAALCPVPFVFVIFAVNALTIFSASAQELKPITEIKAIAGRWQGILTGPRGTGPYELTIKEDGSWIANGFQLTFKGNATVANGKARFFSNTTNRAGSWTLTERNGKKRLIVLSDDQRSWGELHLDE
jgi:hypothetical protein